MTEAEWQRCADPVRMVQFLVQCRGRGDFWAGRSWWFRQEGTRQRPLYRASDRKLQLFNCVYGYRLWDRLDEPNRRYLQAQEQIAEGTFAGEDTADLHQAAWPTFPQLNRSARYAEDTLYSDWVPYAYYSCDQREEQADLLRCLLGNPFRHAAVEDPWLEWNGGTVLNLAQVIYDDRRFADLPVLADALEETGCTDETILGHCRGPGPHARGCWVLDLLLGKG